MKKIMTVALGIALLTGASMPLYAQEAASTVSAEPVVRYNENLDGYEYPFPVAHYAFSSQGQDLKMAYMVLPAKDKAKGVVTLLHGKNFNGAYWKDTADYLQSLGYGVLIPDQIGFGKSSKEDDYQYSFAALANNTKNLMHSLGIEKTILVGHSMGGMVASRFALLYPEAVEKLILVNPIGLENYLQFAQYKDIAFFTENELKQTREKIVEYQKRDYYDGAWNDRYAELAEPLIGWVNGDDWDDVAKVNALTTDMIFTQPVIEEFKNFEVPVSLIMGTRDRTAPGKGWMKEGESYEMGRYDLLGAQVKKRNPAIDVVELDGLGHMPQIEDFERFKAVFSDALTLEKESTAE